MKRKLAYLPFPQEKKTIKTNPKKFKHNETKKKNPQKKNPNKKQKYKKAKQNKKHPHQKNRGRLVIL